MTGPRSNNARLAGGVEYADCTITRGKRPLTRPPVGCGWRLLMLEDVFLVIEHSFTWQPSGQVICNIPLWFLLDKTGGQTGLIRPVSWSYPARVRMFCPGHIFQFAFVTSTQPVSFRYFWPLLNYTVIINVHWKQTKIGKASKTYSQLEYTGRVSPS